MRTILLGPQRFMTTAGTALRSLGVDGRVATVNAGWEEREDAVDELDTVLEGRAHHLRLYHRTLDVIAKDEVFATAALDFRDHHDALLSLYRLRLHHTMDGVYAVVRRTRDGELRTGGSHAAYGAVDDAVEAVRHVDAWYAAQLKNLYAELDAAAPLDSSGVIAWHRGEIEAVLADSAALVVTGGHVGTLLRALRLFAIRVPETLPVIAWSAGAMALTERVVLFHDLGPEGATEAEVFDRGLGRVKGVVALPHARRRLRLEDKDRCAVMARRFTDQHCVLLDDGTALELTPEGGLPRGARILGIDGAVHELGVTA
ncbi:MAG: Type 1 glutamine amidotransferase-like domain-containing protein [Pedococcus sp.]